ncbi:hypothetical protein [Paraburkholderia sp. J8-2]|uniref:hypothetical protein n=1 Tax=Paraburkholderia sp. J8-2 TaxID=2805440 RepID=UPI002AB5EB9A|nr:hypothetical protein [Paraburkholderia sp. J8-2]
MKAIQAKFEAQLAREGIAAEITFYAADGFSLLVEDSEQYQAAKALLAKVHGITFDSEDFDPEIGSIAYYKF